MTTPLPNPTPGADTSKVDLTSGTNATLSYSNPGSQSSADNSLKCRVRTLSHSFEVVATESHARIHRAFYPHQRAVGRFALMMELKGYVEYAAFMDFMKSYMNTFLTVSRFAMLAEVPVRNFSQWGIPVHGVSFGDHVGSMVFKTTIIFESVHDPNDPVIFTPGSGNVSDTDLAGVTGDQATFFYPFSTGSVDPTKKAETLYNFPALPSTVEAVTQPAPAATGTNQSGTPGLGGF